MPISKLWPEILPSALIFFRFLDLFFFFYIQAKPHHKIKELQQPVNKKYHHICTFVWGTIEHNNTLLFKSLGKSYYCVAHTTNYSCGLCITCQLPYKVYLPSLTTNYILCAQKLQLHFTQTCTITFKALMNHYNCTPFPADEYV